MVMNVMAWLYRNMQKAPFLSHLCGCIDVCASMCAHERVLSKVVKGTLWYFIAQVPFFFSVRNKIGPGVMRLKSAPDITPGFLIYIRDSANCRNLGASPALCIKGQSVCSSSCHRPHKYVSLQLRTNSTLIWFY